MAIFYTPDIDKHPFLSQEESGHCVRVLRLSVGDEITLCDGKGNFYKAIIADTLLATTWLSLQKQCVAPR